ncbi:hypothetical protein Patl1_33481 [Pistacia atlantica]|uniref:Uncharacterized protein n=1 Tax=Pistacia atlantica TaxID=434234 RepID=A0ACC0ZTJ3_9ROSI|nr:hypothetical protein Patl1_33481 [Pistacia atlantica]
MHRRCLKDEITKSRLAFLETMSILLSNVFCVMDRIWAHFFSQEGVSLFVLFLAAIKWHYFTTKRLLNKHRMSPSIVGFIESSRVFAEDNKEDGKSVCSFHCFGHDFTPKCLLHSTFLVRLSKHQR